MPRKEMTSAEKAERMIEIFIKSMDIYKAKNEDYGNSYGELYNAFSDINSLLGIGAITIRLEDKLNRIISLLELGERKVENESILDTLLDLANYAMMGIVEIEQRHDNSLVQ